MSAVRLTIVSDNHAAPGLEAEHGFAIWIEAGGQRILFDTGAGAAFLHNVAVLGIDVASADAIVLSHGHHDHTGNLCTILGQAPGATLYGHPESDIARYSLHQECRAIGMPLAAAVTMAAMRLNKRRAVTRPLALSATVWLTGPIPRQTAFEDGGASFFLDAQCRRPDPISDDLSLWIVTSQGLVVCLGCCHAGIVNTLRHIVQVSGVARIAAVLGGTHLRDATAAQLDQTAAALADFAIPDLVLCHCTGAAAVAHLAARLGTGVVRSGYAGLVWELPPQAAN